MYFMRVERLVKKANTVDATEFTLIIPPMPNVGTYVVYGPQVITEDNYLASLQI